MLEGSTKNRTNVEAMRAIEVFWDGTTLLIARLGRRVKQRRRSI
jgi:hypothetical protein